MQLHEKSEITVQELKKLRDFNKNIQIIDVRDDSERQHVSIKGTKHIKLSELASRFSEINHDENIFVMCHNGIRSQVAVKWLKSKGCNYAVNVLGGIDAWSALIDKTLKRY
tara:strand:- start:149 stop:481 length:333 start_codon:yes stop_codon:yes gene_type:complete